MALVPGDAGSRHWMAANRRAILCRPLYLPAGDRTLLRGDVAGGRCGGELAAWPRDSRRNGGGDTMRAHDSMLAAGWLLEGQPPPLVSHARMDARQRGRRILLRAGALDPGQARRGDRRV